MRKAYLLFELLCAAMILSTTAVAITRAFSKQMEVSGIAFQQAEVYPFMREKIFEIEKQLMENPDSLEEMKTLSGIVPETSLKWTMTSESSEKYPSLLKVKFEIAGLKNERTIAVNMFMNASAGAESKSRAEAFPEGEGL